MSLELLFKAAPATAIPKSNTKAYRLLVMLLSGELPEVHLLISLGGNCRSPLQALMNGTHDYWNIIPVYDHKHRIIARKLDPRHLSGDPMLDARARAERRYDLANDSLKQSIQEQARVNKAFAELIDAEANLLELQKENASEDNFEGE